MQGINSSEHRSLLAAFRKFEHMAAISKNRIEESEDAKTRRAMNELDALYDKFQVLFVELKKCSEDYEIKKKSTRSIINKSLRKLIPVFI